MRKRIVVIDMRSCDKEDDLQNIVRLSGLNAYFFKQLVNQQRNHCEFKFADAHIREYDYGFMLIDQDDNVLCSAFMSLHKKDNTTTAWLHSVCTRNESRQQGMCTNLLRYVAQWWREQNLSQSLFITPSSQAAANCYKHVGFSHLYNVENMFSHDWSDYLRDMKMDKHDTQKQCDASFEFSSYMTKELANGRWTLVPLELSSHVAQRLTYRVEKSARSRSKRKSRTRKSSRKNSSNRKKSRKRQY